MENLENKNNDDESKNTKKEENYLSMIGITILHMSPIFLILFFDISLISIIYLFISFLFVMSFIREKRLDKNSNYDVFFITFLIVVPICQFIIYNLCLKKIQTRIEIDLYVFELFNIKINENKQIDNTGTYLWEIVALISYLFLFSLKKCIGFDKKIIIDYEQVKMTYLFFKFMSSFLLTILIIDKFNLFQVFYTVLLISNLSRINYNYYCLEVQKKLAYFRIILLFLIISVIGIFNFSFTQNYLKTEFPYYFNEKNDEFFFLLTNKFDKRKVYYLLLLLIFSIELIKAKIIEYVDDEEQEDAEEINRLSLKNKNSNSIIENEEEKINEEGKKKENEKETEISYIEVTKNKKKYDSDSSNEEVEVKKRNNLRDKFRTQSNSISPNKIDNKNNNEEHKNNNKNICEVQLRKKKHKPKYYLFVFKNDIMRISIIYLVYISQNVFSIFYSMIFLFSFFECSNYDYNINLLFNLLLTYDFIGFSFISSGSDIALKVSKNKTIMKYFFNSSSYYETFHRIMMLLILIINHIFVNIVVYKTKKRKNYFFLFKQENKYMQLLNSCFNKTLCLVVLPFFSGNDFFNLMFSLPLIGIYFVKSINSCQKKDTEKLIYELTGYYILILYCFCSLMYFFSENPFYKTYNYCLIVVIIMFSLKENHEHHMKITNNNTNLTHLKKLNSDDNEENIKNNDNHNHETNSVKIEINDSIRSFKDIQRKTSLFVIYLLTFGCLCFDSSFFNLIKYVIFCCMIYYFLNNNKHTNSLLINIFYAANFIQLILILVFQFILKFSPNMVLTEIGKIILKNDLLFERIITPDKNKSPNTQDVSIIFRLKEYMQEEIMINFFIYLSLYLSFLLKKDSESIEKNLSRNKDEELIKSKGLSKDDKIKLYNLENDIDKKLLENIVDKEVIVSEDKNEKKDEGQNQDPLTFEKEKLLSKFRFNLFICINFLNIFLMIALYEISLISIYQILFSFCIIILHIRKMNDKSNKDIIIRFEDFWVKDLVMKLIITIIYYLSYTYSNFCSGLNNYKICEYKITVNCYLFPIGLYLDNTEVVLLDRIQAFILVFFFYIVLNLLTLFDELKDNIKNYLSLKLHKMLDRKFYFSKKIIQKSISSLSLLLIILKLKLSYIIVYSVSVAIYFLLRCCLQGYNKKNYVFRLKLFLWILIPMTILESTLSFLNLNKNVIDKSLYYIYGKMKEKDIFSWGFPLKESDFDDILRFGINSIEKNSILVNIMIIYLSFIYLNNFQVSPFPLTEKKQLDKKKPNVAADNIERTEESERYFSMESYCLYKKKLLDQENKHINSDESMFSSITGEILETDFYQKGIGKYYLTKRQLKKYGSEGSSSFINSGKDKFVNSFGFKFPEKEEKFEENRKTRPLSKFKKLIFVHFVYINLLIIVLFCCLNPCFINLIYLIFALVYIKNPNLILNYDFDKPHFYISWLRLSMYFAFIEFVLIAIYQKTKKDEGILFYLIFYLIKRLKFINKIEDCGQPNTECNYEVKVLLYILFKIFKIFSILIQINIFKSDEFRYYFMYITEKNKFNLLKNGLIHAYKFNNERVNRFKQNEDFREKRTQIYNCLKKYNKNNLCSINSNDNLQMHIKEIIDLRKEVKEQNEKTIITQEEALKNENDFNNENSSKENVLLEKDKGNLDPNKKTEKDIINEDNRVYVNGEEICFEENKLDEIIVEDEINSKNFFEKDDENFDNNKQKEIDIINEDKRVYVNENNIREIIENEKINESNIKDELKANLMIKANNINADDNEIINDSHFERQKKKELKRKKKDIKKYTFIKNIILNKENENTSINYFKEESLYILEISFYVLIIIDSIFFSNFFIGIVIFMIFSYSLIFYPRTKSNFWSYVLYILLTSLLVKFILQLETAQTSDQPDNAGEVYLLLKDFQNFMKMMNYNLLITSYKFHLQLLYYSSQLLGISLILILRTLLIQKGLWERTENKYEKIKEVEDRIKKFKDCIEKMDDVYIKYNIEDFKDKINSFLKDQLDKMKEKEKKKQKLNNGKNSSEESIKKNIFRKYERVKPGRDFHTANFVLGSSILIYILIFNDKMDMTKDWNIYELISGANITTSHMILVGANFFIILADRFLYVNQSSKFFKKEKEEEALPKKKEIHFDLILLGKCILHILVLIELTFLIYFWYPIRGSIYLQKKTGKNDIYNYANNNPYILFLNCLFCGYLYFSALQIRYGYSGFIKKPLLMKYNNPIVLKLFEWQRNIPIVYFSKHFVDHVFTNSPLEKKDFSKFNLINDSCHYSLIIKNKKRKRWVEDLCKVIDWVLFVSVIFLFFFLPMLINSDVSPWKQFYDIDGSKLEFKLSFKKLKNELSEFNKINNFTLFRSDNVDYYNDIKDEEWGKYGYSNSTSTFDFPQNQVKVCRFYSDSNEYWDLTEQNLIRLRESLNDYKNRTVYISMILKIDRNNDPLIFSKELHFEKIIYDPLEKDLQIKQKYDENIDILKNKINYNSSFELSLDNFYTRAIKVTADSELISLEDSDLKTTNITLDLYPEQSKFLNEPKRYWVITQKGKSEGIEFHFFIEKINTFPFGKSLILILKFIAINLFTPFLSILFKEKSFNQSLLKFKYPDYLIYCCEYLLIQRYKFQFKDREKNEEKDCFNFLDKIAVNNGKLNRLEEFINKIEKRVCVKKESNESSVKNDEANRANDDNFKIRKKIYHLRLGRVKEAKFRCKKDK